MRMNEHNDLSRLYRDAARPEPPRALDDAILAAARRATGERPQNLRSSRRWSVPFALAATVVLSVSITTLVYEERQPGDVSAPASGAAPASPAAESAAAQPRPQSAEPLAKPAYQPAPPARRDAAAALSSPAPENKAAQPVFQAAPAPPAAIANHAAAPAGSLMGGVGATSPAPGMLEKRARSSLNREEAVADTLDGNEHAPERWIADIRELKRAGRATEAADRLVEFRKRFPSYQLPDDLK
jgi:hypothetical protein